MPRYQQMSKRPASSRGGPDSNSAAQARSAEQFRLWPSITGICADRKQKSARGKVQDKPRYPRFKGSLSLGLLKHGVGSLWKSTSQACAAERFRPWPSIKDVCAVWILETRTSAGKSSADAAIFSDLR